MSRGNPKSMGQERMYDNFSRKNFRSREEREMCNSVFKV